MSDIDWSKAPDGATHYSPPKGVFIGLWARQIDGVWYYHRNDSEGWYYGRKPMKDEEYIARPSAAWTGSGLPPVGTVCEYKYNLTALPWYPCEVRYVLDNDPRPGADGWTAVIWCPHLGKEQVARASGFSFRPIRTPEQIAAEEREKAIDEMYSLTRTSSSHEVIYAQRHVCEDLYDAGYRKTEAP